MEITCIRCHQAVQAENCYCPVCGMPQLVYAAEDAGGPGQPERWNEAVRDAGSVEWKVALRVALMLALPAGLLSSGLSPLAPFGFVWMATAAAWAVALYMRSQRPAWITIGAGVRIGLVTGLLAGWLAFGISGGTLFAERYFLHQSSQIDGEWKSSVERSQQITQQWMQSVVPADAMQAEAAQNRAMEAFMLSPEGHAGYQAFGYVANSVFLLFFAVAGGALGARLLVRSRRPEV